jgi:hypothetical protein
MITQQGISMNIMSTLKPDEMAAQWFVFNRALTLDQAALKKIYTETTDIDLMDILRDAEHITKLKADIKFNRHLLSNLEYEMALSDFDYGKYNITPLYHSVVTAANYMRQGLLRNNGSTE